MLTVFWLRPLSERFFGAMPSIFPSADRFPLDFSRQKGHNNQNQWIHCHQHRRSIMGYVSISELICFAVKLIDLAILPGLAGVEHGGIFLIQRHGLVTAQSERQRISTPIWTKTTSYLLPMPSSQSYPKCKNLRAEKLLWDWENGAANRTRTGTESLQVDFKSTMSTIPS